MAIEDTWSVSEKGPSPPSITRFERWKKKRLLWILLVLSVLMLLLAITTGIIIYYHSDDPAMQKTLAFKKNPCDKMLCAFGALCLVDDRTQRPYCDCPHVCPDIFAPLCGDDGVTYASDCQLRRASCTQQRRIATKRQGPCDIKDPCANTECQYGAECHPSPDGTSAQCVCPDRCRSEDTGYGSRPVCGTDGREYQNSCLLAKTSCKETRSIEVKYKGVCDPCDGVECQTFQVCQLDDSRNPICRCNSICSPDFKPVCGSDGKTYTSECTLRAEACKSRRNIRIIYTGECGTGSNPCDSLQCGPGQHCDIDRDGVATCQCIERCQKFMRPVCGTDGETYENECELQRHACLQRKSVMTAYRGQCGARGPCFRFHCSYGAMCVVKSSLPTCECPTCTEEFEPVCGTDGISYTNNCKLRREACEQKSEIAVAYSGLCKGCENKRCEYYAVCESDEDKKGRCVCPESCFEIDAKVCGTDGVTYSNECEMRVAACKKAQYVMVVSKGPCDLCQNVRCKYGARCVEGRCICPTKCPKLRESVCANDGMTYANECEMRQAACRNNQDLNMLFFGECDEVGGSEQDIGSGMEGSCHSKTCKYGGECAYDEDGSPVCICNLQCPTLLDPVCASDGRLYDNDCRIKEESCRIQKSLMPVHIEMCEEVREVSCAGEIPLVDPTTGKDYFCGDGIGSKLCPPGSYCHKSSAFAKCCSEVILVKTCAESVFGCCMDGKTAAQGPNYAGCPSTCNCNRLGSYGLSCDPYSKQCACKPGVGGPRCDRCEPGYWGLQKNTDESLGCSPCACNLFGSVRDDCEQMTGRCVCKHGIQGMKCDICPPGTVLGPDGCMDSSIAQPITGSCEDLLCFHGAMCRQTLNKAQCICDFNCSPEDNRDLVCGSDGNTYGSECQMKLFSCRYQKIITAVSNAPCSRVLKPAVTVSGESRLNPITARSAYNASVILKRNRRHKNVAFWEKRFLKLQNPKKKTNKHRGPKEKIYAHCGNSQLVLRNRGKHGDFALKFKIIPFGGNDEGVIFYCSFPGNKSHFASLVIINKFLQFRFFNGKEITVLELPLLLSPGLHYNVLVKLTSTHITLQVGTVNTSSRIKHDGLFPMNIFFLKNVPLDIQRHETNVDLLAFKCYLSIANSWIKDPTSMSIRQHEALRNITIPRWTVSQRGKRNVCANIPPFADAMERTANRSQPSSLPVMFAGPHVNNTVSRNPLLRRTHIINYSSRTDAKVIFASRSSSALNYTQQPY